MRHNSLSIYGLDSDTRPHVSPFPNILSNSELQGTVIIWHDDDLETYAEARSIEIENRSTCIIII